ncbi:MAG: hypothetical protein DRZ82_02725 [Thermoprotei archaeon]|nr:MAG: hypothetical protein DRZ82_02725 [Thermoprotei archaeon]
MLITLFPALHGERDLPLGLLYIAQTLIEHGYQVRIVDLNLHVGKNIDLGRISAIRDADLFGFSSYRYTMSADISIAWQVRLINDSPMIWGGWGPTTNPLLYIRYAPADIIIPGVHMQAPKVMLDVVKCIEKRRDISIVKGIVYRDGDIIVDTGLGEIPDRIPPLKWDIISHVDLALEDYIEDGVLLVPILGALASCPKYYESPCIYCSIGRVISEYKITYGTNRFNELMQRLMQFDVDRIIQDMENAIVYFNDVLKDKLKRISFTLVDDAVTPENFLKLYKKLVENGLINEFSFMKFQTRPEYIPKILKNIRREHRSKFIMDVGFEFFSERDLLFTNRGSNPNMLANILRELSEKRVHWTGYVILATPVTTAEDLEKNINLAINIAYNSDLLRCNPYLLEEDTYIPLKYGWKAIEWKCIKIYSEHGQVTVVVPHRPRFFIGNKEIERMIKVIDYYIEKVEKLREKAFQKASKIIAERGEIDLNDSIGTVTRVYSLGELRDSLMKLRKALVEDYISKERHKAF